MEVEWVVRFRWRWPNENKSLLGMSIERQFNRTRTHFVGITRFAHTRFLLRTQIFLGRLLLISFLLDRVVCRIERRVAVAAADIQMEC